MGFGVGLGWAHLVTKVIGLVGNAEQDKASAAISTVQSLGGGFGSSLPASSSMGPVLQTQAASPAVCRRPHGFMH